MDKIRQYEGTWKNIIQIGKFMVTDDGYWNRNVKTNFTIFTNPSARAGYDTRSIFKRSFTGLNSEFSFS